MGINSPEYLDSNEIDISHLDKAEVLAALYSGAGPLGVGFMRFDEGAMSVEEAQAILDKGQTYFDYLKGRVMKIDLSSDMLDTKLYNRNNGVGAAENIIYRLG